jgi:hypothetical protein
MHNRILQWHPARRRRKNVAAKGLKKRKQKIKRGWNEIIKTKHKKTTVAAGIRAQVSTATTWNSHH